MKESDKILARQSILSAIQSDPEHAKLAAINFNKDLSLDQEAASNGCIYERIWVQSEHSFIVSDYYSGLIEGQKNYLLNPRILKENAIRRFCCTLLKSNPAQPSENVDLVFQFLREKLFRNKLEKFIGKISLSRFKDLQSKLRSIVTKMDTSIAQISHYFDALEVEQDRYNTIQDARETDNIIAEILLPLQSELLSDNVPAITVEESVRKPSEQLHLEERASLLRILANIIYDGMDPKKFTIPHCVSYPVDPLNPFTLLNGENIDQIFSLVKELYNEDLPDRKLLSSAQNNFIKSLYNTYLEKLLLSGIIACKSQPYAPVNEFFSLSTSSDGVECDKYTIELELSNGSIKIFNNVPAINLQNLGLYQRMLQHKMSESEQKLIKIRSKDIGSIIGDSTICNFINFIATGIVAEQITIKDFMLEYVKLQEVFDYFQIDLAVQQQIIFNYLHKVVQVQEGWEVSRALFECQKRRSEYSAVLFSRQDKVELQDSVNSYKIYRHWRDYIKARIG